MGVDRQPQPGEGKATWEYDHDKGVHIPRCSRYRWKGLTIAPCGNVLYSGKEIMEGACRQAIHWDNVVPVSSDYL